MDTVHANKLRAVAAYSLRTAALLCTTGPLMQTLLATLGFSSRWIYIHATLVQGVNTVTILLCARWADSGNAIRKSALVQVPHGLLYLLYIPLCIWKSPSLVSFAALTAITVLQVVSVSLYTVCEYKIPYFIFPARDYGQVLAMQGIFSSLLTLGAGALVSALTPHVPYLVIMAVACVLSAALMLGAAFLYSRQQPVFETEEFGQSVHRHMRIPFSATFSHPSFYRLIPANLMRGFGYGAVLVAAALALELGFDQQVSTAMVSVQSAASLLACGVFARLSRRVSPRVSVLVGSVSYGLLPLLLWADQTVFLAVYGIAVLGRTLIDNAVPALLRFVVPPEISGPYHAWRMMLHNGGAMLATAAAAFIPPGPFILLAAACQLCSGAMYMLYRDRGDSHPSAR